MTKYGGDKGFLLVDGYDLGNYTTTFDASVEAMTEDTMGLGDSWQEPAATGLKSAGFGHEGFYDDAAGATNAALTGQHGVSRVICAGIEGDTVGKRFVGFQGAVQSQYRRILKRGELHKGSAAYMGSGQADEGVILHRRTAETASSGNTEGADSVDSGAGTSNGGVAYLQVTALALGGYTSVTLKVRHSADDITYADLTSFTNVTAAPAVERKTVAGTVNRHLAMSWAFNGSGSAQSVTPFVGFARA